jgi:hypothetical protein
LDGAPPVSGYSAIKRGHCRLLFRFFSLQLFVLGRYPPYIPLVGQGVAYTIFAAALWPSVPYAVDAQYIGTANGVMTSIQNSGLAVFPIILATILKPCAGNPAKSSSTRLSKDLFDYCEKTLDNYMYAELFFVGLAGFGTLIGIWLTVDDWTNRNSILHNSHVTKTPKENEDDDVDDALLSVQGKK